MQTLGAGFERRQGCSSGTKPQNKQRNKIHEREKGHRQGKRDQIQV